MDLASIVTTVSTVAGATSRLRTALAAVPRSLMRFLITATASLTLPGMLGFVTPSVFVDTVQSSVQQLIGLTINVDDVLLVVGWLAANPGLGRCCAVVAFLAGLATFPAYRVHDGVLAFAWLMAMAATLGGQGRLLLVGFLTTFWVAELATAWLPDRYVSPVLFIRYPMRLTMTQPFRYLLMPVLGYARTVTGQTAEVGTAAASPEPTEAIQPTDPDHRILARIADRRFAALSLHSGDSRNGGGLNLTEPGESTGEPW